MARVAGQGFAWLEVGNTLDRKTKAAPDGRPFCELEIAEFWCAMPEVAKAEGAIGLVWVDWFNHRRLLEPIGNIPLAEAEARYYAQTEVQALAA